MPGYPLGWTVGIEFETENIPPSNTMIPQALGFSPTHDSSIESPMFFIGGIRTVGTQFLRSISPSSNGVSGVELVSVPFNLETESPVQNIFKLTKWLTEQGETPQSDRAGIHLHIGVGRDVGINLLQTILKWGMYAEGLFFRIGGNGYAFRGIKNASAFCRPITKNGPPAVPIRDAYYKCYDVDQLLTTKSAEDFWLGYGNTNVSSPPRYVPQRYSWLNFYSIPAHSTIEFRIFNKTLNPLYIMSEIELVHKLTVACLGNIQPPDTNGSVYDNESDECLIHKLHVLGRIINLSDKSLRILENIIRLTPPVRLDPSPIVTHLIETQRVSNPWDGVRFSPVAVKDPMRAPVVTIHNIRSSGSGIAALLQRMPSMPTPAPTLRMPEPEDESDEEYHDEDDEDEEEQF